MKLEELSQDHISMLKDERGKVKQCKRYMKNQQDQVVKPLLLEVAIKDEMIKRLRADHEDVVHDLKKL